MARSGVVVLGDVALDVLVRPVSSVAPGGDIPARVRGSGGGSGGNTAAWLATLDVPVTMLARIGDDVAGRQVTDELTARGVRCAFAVDGTEPTCAVVVLVDPDGQRTMYSDRGAAARLAVADVDPDLVRAAAHLHVSGYVLLDESSRTAGLAALELARAAGVPTSVDPQAVAVLGARFLAMVGGVDLLLPNTDELRELTGSTDPASAADLLDVVGAVAVTDGAAGASWVDRRGVHAAPARPVECVDSTGAGDAFDAGVIAGLLAGHDSRAALLSGIAAGSAAVGQVGASPRSPRDPGSQAAGSSRRGRTG